MNRRRLLFQGARILVIVYVGFAIFAWAIADRIIFQPPKPPDYTMTEDLTTIRVGSRSIVARYHAVEKARGTVIFAHGNGRDIGDVWDATNRFEALGFNTIAFDYEGYGHSGGDATESNSYADIAAVYEYVVHKKGAKPTDILAAGHSLGGGPAAWLAEHRKVRALLLVSTFTSAFNVAIPTWLLPFDEYEIEDRLPQIRVPVAIVHGTADEIIDVDNARDLYAAARQPKKEVLVPGGGHNEIFSDQHLPLRSIVDWLWSRH